MMRINMNHVLGYLLLTLAAVILVAHQALAGDIARRVVVNKVTQQVIHAGYSDEIDNMDTSVVDIITSDFIFTSESHGWWYVAASNTFYAIPEATQMMWWAASKGVLVTNLETRFIEVLDLVETALKDESVITGGTELYPTNISIPQVTLWMLSMTNKTEAANLGSRLTILLSGIESAIGQTIGDPPDGSEILYNIE